MIRGPYGGRNELYDKAVKLRKQNLGYKTIAAEIGVSWGTIKNWVKDIKVDPKLTHANAMKRVQVPLESLVKTSSIRKRLISIRGHQCEKCKATEWFDKPIWIEAHHIDGNNKNNTPENLQLLCLNCHATTYNYRFKNGGVR